MYEIIESVKNGDKNIKIVKWLRNRDRKSYISTSLVLATITRLTFYIKTDRSKRSFPSELSWEIDRSYENLKKLTNNKLIIHSQR